MLLLNLKEQVERHIENGRKEVLWLGEVERDGFNLQGGELGVWLGETVGKKMVSGVAYLKEEVLFVWSIEKELKEVIRLGEVARDGFNL